MGYAVISGHQLCGMLRKVSGFGGPLVASADPVEMLRCLVEEGCLRLPFDVECVFWTPHRLPVFMDIRMPMHRSQLLSQLGARIEDTGLVVDSIRSAGEAIFLARLVEAHRRDQVTEWVNYARPDCTEIFIKSIDEFILILAAIKSFVVPGHER